MKLTRTHALYVTIAVAAHVLIGALHTVAHEGLAVELTRLQDIFVQIVYLGLPILSAILLWTRLARAANASLGLYLGLPILSAILLWTRLALAASFAFVTWYHFILVSPDHVGHLPEGEAQSLFQVTAALMSLMDAGGAWLGSHLARLSGR